MIVLLCSLVLLLSMASCSELEDVYLSLKNSTPIPPRVITEAQALAALDQAVKAAQRKDIDALCELSTMFDYCLDMVKSSGGEESIPQEPPTIVRIESHQEKGNHSLPLND